MKIGVCLPYMKRGLNRQTFQDWSKSKLQDSLLDLLSFLNKF